MQVSFTGSTEVGKIIGAAAAKNIKPVTLVRFGRCAVESCFVGLPAAAGQCRTLQSADVCGPQPAVC